MRDGGPDVGDVRGAGEAGEAVEELLAAPDPAGLLHERGEQAELRGSELERPVPARDLVGLGVEHDKAQGGPRGLAVDAPRCAVVVVGDKIGPGGAAEPAQRGHAEAPPLFRKYME